MDKPITGLLRKRASQMMGYNLRTANLIICVSEPLKSHLISKWKVPAEKVIVFPNGVDLQRFRPDPEARSKVRSSLGIDRNPLIIFVGNFFPWHDVSTLLDAFARLIKVKPDVRLLLVGDGQQRQAMVQRTIDLSMQSSVRFTGLVAHTDVPQLMAAADVAVVPYPVMKHDLWLSPLKVFEYMASGAAIVASRVGQLTEVIHDGHNGLLVPPGDVPAMVAALRTLVEDSALRSRLGLQAREDAVRIHSWNRYLSRLESLFATVIAGRPAN
jgi:glycosyltransferase involved in cell wall biosynthesis